MCTQGTCATPHTTLVPYSSPVLGAGDPGDRSGTRVRKDPAFFESGQGDQWQRVKSGWRNSTAWAQVAVEVLCEDHSGTYQLPFACRFVDGHWRNHESGGAVEATVIGWRLRRVKQAGMV